MVWVGSNSASNPSFTAFNSGLFFKGFYHGCCAYPKYPCRISDATAVNRHVADLLFDVRCIGCIAILSDKRTAFTIRILTMVALFSCGSGAMLNHFNPITISG